MKIDQSTKPRKTWQDKVGGWPSHPLNWELTAIEKMAPPNLGLFVNELVITLGILGDIKRVIEEPCIQAVNQDIEQLGVAFY
jgi:hypothetical protein